MVTITIFSSLDADALRFLGWVAVVLFVTSAAYAYFLDHIHHIYSPDHVGWTVVAGEGIVLFFLAIVMSHFDQRQIAITPWDAWWIWAFGQAVAGIPIMFWQRRQNRRRKIMREENNKGRNHGTNANGPRW